MVTKSDTLTSFRMLTQGHLTKMYGKVFLTLYVQLALNYVSLLVNIEKHSSSKTPVVGRDGSKFGPRGSIVPPGPNHPFLDTRKDSPTILKTG
jgi:hypothetical protein